MVKGLLASTPVVGFRNWFSIGIHVSFHSSKSTTYSPNLFFVSMAISRVCVYICVNINLVFILGNLLLCVPQYSMRGLKSSAWLHGSLGLLGRQASGSHMRVVKWLACSS